MGMQENLPSNAVNGASLAQRFHHSALRLRSNSDDMNAVKYRREKKSKSYDYQRPSPTQTPTRLRLQLILKFRSGKISRYDTILPDIGPP
jgi:hypothetical protein